MIAFYRALLRLYPASFRAEYGDEMAAVFAQAYADATPLGRIGLLLTATADEVPNALAVHWAILLQDLRYTVRTLNRARGFALTAILVTALGVGANTAAFSVADFVLLRLLPFGDPDALVLLCEGPRTGAGWGCMNQLSPANYRDLKAMTSSFDAMGALADDAVNLVGVGEPRRVPIAPITPEVLPLLGVQPALGRVFQSNDADARAVVISYGLWQSAFGGDRGVLDRTIALNGAAYTIIGVMPRGFYFQGGVVTDFAVSPIREHSRTTSLCRRGRQRPAGSAKTKIACTKPFECCPVSGHDVGIDRLGGGDEPRVVLGQPPRRAALEQSASACLREVHSLNRKSLQRRQSGRLVNRAFQHFRHTDHRNDDRTPF